MYEKERWKASDNSVWVRGRHIVNRRNWDLIEHPEWLENMQYIVNDNEAEIRKAEADSENIYMYREDDGWVLIDNYDYFRRKHPSGSFKYTEREIPFEKIGQGFLTKIVLEYTG